MMIKKLLNPLDSGWGSNTHPLSTIISILDKRVLIDWLSITTDCINVHDFSSAGVPVFEIDYDSKELRQIVSFFGYPIDKPLNLIPRVPKPLNGYYSGLQLGEHIYLLYGGKHTKNSNDRFSLQLLISGQGCREYENIYNGQWHHLLNWFLERKSNIKRLDIAIDDFKGDQFNIYDLDSFLKKGYFISPLRRVNIQHTFQKYDEGLQLESFGYTVNIGTTSGTQLCIYDKNAERKNKGFDNMKTDVWYRYEMRFKDDKAKAVAELYVSSINDNQSEEFMRLASDLLLTNLELKDFKKDKNISRWPTNKKWLEFVGSLIKIKLNCPIKEKTTMIRKKLWYQSAVSESNLLLMNYLGIGEFNKMFYEDMLEKVKNLDESKLRVLNNGLQDKGLPPKTMEEIREFGDMLRVWLGEEVYESDISTENDLH